MSNLTKVVIAGALVFGFGAGSALAAPPTDQRAQQQKDRAASEQRTDLHEEIASPVNGAFSAGAEFTKGYQQDVGGFPATASSTRPACPCPQPAAVSSRLLPAINPDLT